ncbi:hypothetical protein Tco_1269041, partial [Tanacetum coccineum]
KVLNNMDAHIDYIKHSQEHADTLREIFEHARALRPLDNDLDYACKIVQRIQEVIVYVKATCPSLTKHSEKLVAVTPLNKNKKVRLSKLLSGIWTPDAQAYDMKPLLAHQLCSQTSGYYKICQFYDSDLEVAFRKHACYIRELEGVDLLKGSRVSNLYILSLKDMMLSSLIYFLSKASKTKSWLWRRRVSYLNLDSITVLAIQGLLYLLKFPVDGGIVTIYNTVAPPKECNTVTCDVTQTQRQHATKVTNLKVAIHPDYPEQEVSIGGRCLIRVGRLFAHSYKETSISLHGNRNT